MHNETNAQTFPTAPDENGYFFESQQDQEGEIRTKVYDNDNKTKTITLRKGQVAVMRELTGKDTKHVQRFMNQDQEKYTMAGIAVATSIDGKPETFEFFEALKWKDTNRLIIMFGDLNF